MYHQLKQESINLLILPSSRTGESDQIPVEFLNAINISGLPVSKITLKVSCPVMLLLNLSTKEGLCNGTSAIVAILSM